MFLTLELYALVLAVDLGLWVAVTFLAVIRRHAMWAAMGWIVGMFTLHALMMGLMDGPQPGVQYVRNTGGILWWEVQP